MEARRALGSMLFAARPTDQNRSTMTLSPAPTTVTAHIEGVVVEAAELVLSVAVAKGPEISAEEVRLAVDGEPVAVEELVGPDGTRLHIMTVPPGKLEFD